MTDQPTIVAQLKEMLINLNQRIEEARDERFSVTLDVKNGLGRLTIRPPEGGQITIEAKRRATQ